MIQKIFLYITIFTLVISSNAATESQYDLKNLYNDLNLQDKLSFAAFKISVQGFEKIKKQTKFNNRSIITIIDFSKPSTMERLFVIDIDTKKLLSSSLVAHGKNSGANYARNFSNRSGSLQSSLGFFITSHTYYGKHGYSLRLKGIEDDINDKAEKRTIVIHKANYVSQNFIKKYGRLGRSWGCPALPAEKAGKIIDIIKEGTALFIYADDKNYLTKSKYVH